MAISSELQVGTRVRHLVVATAGEGVVVKTYDHGRNVKVTWSPPGRKAYDTIESVRFMIPIDPTYNYTPSQDGDRDDDL